MDKKQKVWIRGCEGRGAEVIQKLVALGGRDLSVALTALAVNPCLIFAITHLGVISYSGNDTEYAKIVMEEYTEIKLDEKADDEPMNKIKEQPEFNVDDMVLRRAKPGEEWKVYQYWYILTMGGLCPLVEIIPYNEDTKHLLYTTDDYAL